jgi:hypothetical protein
MWCRTLCPRVGPLCAGSAGSATEKCSSCSAAGERRGGWGCGGAAPRRAAPAAVNIGFTPTSILLEPPASCAPVAASAAASQCGAPLDRGECRAPPAPNSPAAEAAAERRMESSGLRAGARGGGGVASGEPSRRALPPLPPPPPPPLPRRAAPAARSSGFACAATPSRAAAPSAMGGEK